MDDLARGAPVGNLDQLALTYTPAPNLSGRRLFPDDALAASKAVDASGNPIRLFHGSPWGEVRTPDPNRWAYHDQLLAGPGHYVTDAADIAETYAKPGGTVRRYLQPEELLQHYSPGAQLPDQGLGGAVVSSTEQRPNGDIVVTAIDKITGRPYSFRPSDEVIQRANSTVNSYFLDSRSPLDLTKEIPQDEARRILSAVQSDPNFGAWDYGDFTDDVANTIGYVEPGRTMHFYRAMADTLENGKADLNRILSGIGYDAIRHVGGLAAGRGDRIHDVWNVLKPSALYEPFLESAVRGKWANPPSNLGMLAAILAGGGAGLAMQPQ